MRWRRPRYPTLQVGEVRLRQVRKRGRPVFLRSRLSGLVLYPGR